MTISSAESRHGFTLVELLVVASIIAVLFGLVLAGANPGSGGNVRLAARQFASLLLATQSRALGQTAGAAVILESEGEVAKSIFNGDSLPLIEGTVATGFPPANPAVTSSAVSITPSNAAAAELSGGYRIQFYDAGGTPQLAVPPSAWMKFTPPGTVSFRGENSQTTANTIWPPSVSGGYLARVVRYPAKGDRVLEMPKGAFIDLRFSGSGDDPATSWGNLANKGALALSFDSVGEVDALMQQVLTTGTRPVQPLEPREPVFFLFSTQADFDDSSLGPLASERSLWVVVHPQTGRVTISSNVPQTGTNAQALRDARASARAGASIGN